ncbi:DUF2628 domain-containing protein [Pediococcus pentosaceus]|nr:DUF2628 domain-containing protein [Pediococcus pentosaceus]KAF0468580.1 DUF2628 domain-containing protein [Pediococcus pentosaceus]
MGRVNLKNPVTNQFKQAKVDFSWTTFFFGLFPALFRGDWKWFFVMLVVSIILGVPTMGIGAGLVGIVFAFFYNKLYINDLLSKGWVPSDESSKSMLLSKGFTTR